MFQKNIRNSVVMFYWVLLLTVIWYSNDTHGVGRTTSWAPTGNDDSQLTWFQVSTCQCRLETVLDSILNVNLPLGILWHIVVEWLNCSVQLKLLTSFFKPADSVNWALWPVSSDNCCRHSRTGEYDDGRRIALN